MNRIAKIATSTGIATVLLGAFVFVRHNSAQDPTPGLASAVTSPTTGLLQPPAAASAPALQASAASAVAAAPSTVSKQDYEELLKRVSQLEGDVRDVLAGLRAKGYLNAATADLPMDFKPYPVAAAPQAGAARPMVKRIAQRKPVRAPVVAVTPPVQPANQLLAVDLWDGKPSVVVGTGVVGDSRIKVLQEGESLNGVTLQQADVAGRQATFKAAGREIRLTVPAGEQ
jgi:hypothetical protein